MELSAPDILHSPVVGRPQHMNHYSELFRAVTPLQLVNSPTSDQKPFHEQVNEPKNRLVRLQPTGTE